MDLCFIVATSLCGYFCAFYAIVIIDVIFFSVNLPDTEYPICTKRVPFFDGAKMPPAFLRAALPEWIMPEPG